MKFSEVKSCNIVRAIPVLRKLKEFIPDTNSFYFHKEHLTKTKRRCFALYGSFPFLIKVVKTLEACRVLMAAQFINRFFIVDRSILWTTLLEPRFGLNSGY